MLAFAMACANGDLEQLLGLLDPHVVFRSDGGGRVTAARLPIRGAERVARALIALTRHEVGEEGPPARGSLTVVNGAPGILTDNGSVLTALSFRFDAGRIVAVDSVRNPDKLGHVGLG